jgi:hypothetical protein
MDKRGSVIGGLILIAMGLLFLLLQTNPEIAAQIDLGLHWPLIIVAVGVLFLLGALLGTAGMAVPGMIMVGLGGLFYYQSMSGNWASWAYTWTLIPGFVGLGIILMGLLDSDSRSSIRGGITLLFISLVMFAIFGGFMGGFGILQQFWPVLLIVAGILILLRNRSGRRSADGEKEQTSTQ